jgi:hypothetical protein
MVKLLTKRFAQKEKVKGRKSKGKGPARKRLLASPEKAKRLPQPTTAASLLDPLSRVRFVLLARQSPGTPRGTGTAIQRPAGNDPRRE